MMMVRRHRGPRFNGTCVRGSVSGWRMVSGLAAVGVLWSVVGSGAVRARADDPAAAPEPPVAVGAAPVTPDSGTKDNDETAAQKLADRLRGAAEAPPDRMGRIISQMGVVEQKLARSFDAGSATQEAQRQIIHELEQAIAASVRRGSRGASGTSGASDRRSRAEAVPAAKRLASPDDAAPSPESGARAGESKTEIERGGRFRDTLRGWGNLPERDRDEVIQGATEKSLEKFRDWVERYYQSLSEERR